MSERASQSSAEASLRERTSTRIQVAAGLGCVASLVGTRGGFVDGVIGWVVMVLGAVCGVLVFYGYWYAHEEEMRQAWRRDAAYGAQVRRAKGFREPRRWTRRRLRRQVDQGVARLEGTQRTWVSGRDVSTARLQARAVRERLHDRREPVEDLAGQWHEVRATVIELDPVRAEKRRRGRR